MCSQSDQRLGKMLGKLRSNSRGGWGTDRTPEIIDALTKRYSNVTAFHDRKRRGKGFGIKKGLEVAKGEKLAFIDSDMEYAPESLPNMVKSIGPYDIVIGVRRGSKQRAGNRIIFSKLHHIIMKVFFHVNLPDIQSGLKVMKREIFEKVKPLTSNGFEIDSEILVKAVRKGYKVGCVPIIYHPKGSSKVNLVRDPLKMFFHS